MPVQATGAVVEKAVEVAADVTGGELDDDDEEVVVVVVLVVVLVVVVVGG